MSKKKNPHFKVCFTGAMRYLRADLHDHAMTLGQVPVDRVTKDTDILVLANFKSMSIKACKARLNGTRLLTEDAWMAMPWHRSVEAINDYIDINMFSKVMEDYDD